MRHWTFRTSAEVRAAVAEFVRRYNAQWLVEKNGYRSPVQARAAWTAARLPAAAGLTTLCPRNRARYTD